ncbi:MAG: hypothetical protein ACK4U0_17295 [Mesorhizobium sp.]
MSRAFVFVAFMLAGACLLAAAIGELRERAELAPATAIGRS